MKKDGLSGLPSDLRVDILSRLSIKEAAASSVLARSWQTLWSEVKSLNLHHNPNTTTCYQFVRTLDYIVKHMHAFGMKFDSCAISFPEFGYTKVEVDCLESCICRLLSFKVVQNFDLVMPSLSPIKFIISNQSIDIAHLRMLKVRCGLQLNISKSTFPNLRTLNISEVAISIHDTKETEEELNWFPKVESLTLKYINGQDVIRRIIRMCPKLVTVKIQSNSERSVDIKSSSVKRASFNFVSELENGCHMKIPSTCEFLKVKDWFLGNELEIPEDNSLKRVWLLNDNWKYCIERDNGNSFDKVKKTANMLFRVLQNIRSLHLSSAVLNNIDIDSVDLPIFTKLENLEVEISCCGLRTFKAILDHCVVVKDLVLKICSQGFHERTPNKCYSYAKWELELLKSSNLSYPTIQTIKIFGQFEYKEDLEAALLTHLLLACGDLKELQVVIPPCFHDKAIGILNAIRKLPRTSRCVKIPFLIKEKVEMLLSSHKFHPKAFWNEFYRDTRNDPIRPRLFKY